MATQAAAEAAALRARYGRGELAGQGGLGEGPPVFQPPKPRTAAGSTEPIVYKARMQQGRMAKGLVAFEVEGVMTSLSTGNTVTAPNGVETMASVDGYLPLLPGEEVPRKRVEARLLHNGEITNYGGLARFYEAGEQAPPPPAKPVSRGAAVRAYTEAHSTTATAG